MTAMSIQTDNASAVDRYLSVRATTEALAAPLSPEDQTVQSMPDVSPTKWHRAHTTWFFETFLLEPSVAGYRTFHPAYCYLFNSYYEAVGARHTRAERGLLSRPGVEEIATYRSHVDEAMTDVVARDGVTPLVELGLHHEQQHQELLLMDIKHVLSRNPLLPTYAAGASHHPSARPRDARQSWIAHDGGAVDIGHEAASGQFSFDNECPRHTTWLQPFEIADRPVTCGEWIAFIDDGGYQRPDLWLSDGWATVQAEGWDQPLYWSTSDGERRVFTLAGDRAIDPAEPVCHVSYFEADAFARWSGARLPTESEWEVAAAPRWSTGAGGYREVWEWTSSAYSPYPGFQPAAGAVGEYNGKFMVNQYVLRGASCATPAGHERVTYRNFFPASARWAFSGLRLARDL